jgi:hypothetical protein
LLAKQPPSLAVINLDLWSRFAARRYFCARFFCTPRALYQLHRSVFAAGGVRLALIVSLGLLVEAPQHTMRPALSCFACEKSSTLDTQVHPTGK